MCYFPVLFFTVYVHKFPKTMITIFFLQVKYEQSRLIMSLARRFGLAYQRMPS